VNIAPEHLAGYTQDTYTMSAMSEDDLSFWHKFQDSLEQKGDNSTVPADRIFREELAAATQGKPLRYEEFYYLLSRYPYLDLHHPDGFAQNTTPKIITLKGGWDIQDFGDRIRTSPGRFLYGAYNPAAVDEDGDDGSDGSKGGKSGGDGILRPQGGLTEQMIDMADEMILLAMEKEWPEAVVLGGFYGMIRAAWVAADVQEYKVTGFEPSESDAVVNAWVRQLLAEKQKKMKERHALLVQKKAPGAAHT
jgi:hypothetical protein